MYGQVIVTSYVNVHEGSKVTYRIDSSNDVYMRLTGTQGPPFDLYFDRASLRNFLTKGNEALTRMDNASTQDS